MSTCRWADSPREAASLRWASVDFSSGTITLDGKTGKRTVPMGPYLAALLGDLRRIGLAVVPIDGSKPQASLWVFPSVTSASGHIVDASAAHGRLLAAAGLPHVSQRDLRRTYASLADSAGVPAGAILQIQGHKPQSVHERHYVHREMAALCEIQNRYEGWILAQAGIEQPKADVAKPNTINMI